MTKTPKEEVLEAVSDRFHTYLRRGVRCEKVIGSAHPELEINDIDTLLKVHFVLTEAENDSQSVGVIDFVRELENRIRMMKTSTSSKSIERRGEVRGHIDWQKTTKARARAGNLEEPVFVSNQPEEYYNIDENLILKRLLSVINDIVQTDLDHALSNPSRYEWLEAWTDPPAEGASDALESTVDMFKRVFNRNIYLQRIDSPSELTDRTIESVKRSRSVFYQHAAILLDRYRQLMRHNLDSEIARKILNHTLIAPDKTEVLFELYWLFQILDAYENVRYNVVRDTRENPSLIASWEQDGMKYQISHDSTGESLLFDESPDTESIESDGYLYRMNEVLSTWQRLTSELFNRKGQNSLWGGRPDIVLERFKESEDSEWILDQVFVGEVKYTNDPGYVTTGLRELLEYMAFVRQRSANKGYIEAPENVLDTELVKGFLFVDELDTETLSSEEIKVLQYPQSLDPIL